MFFSENFPVLFGGKVPQKSLKGLSHDASTTQKNQEQKAQADLVFDPTVSQGEVLEVQKQGCDWDDKIQPVVTH